MATFNFTNSTNNANTLDWSYSTKIEVRTDRKTTLNARGGLVDSVDNLGVGVSTGNPFTVLN